MRRLILWAHGNCFRLSDFFETMAEKLWKLSGTTQPHVWVEFYVDQPDPEFSNN